ncbi:MAG: hypothetical protein GX942_01260, partial [Papillibacter sp.]|nr:hypothetical protein [Papillibacter sp.]
NDSGSLTIVLLNPTLERAEYYGKLCKTGVWIISGKYSRSDLNSDLEEAVNAVKQWIEEHPDKSVRIRGYAPSYSDNIANIHITGYDCAEMEADLKLPKSISLNYNRNRPDARKDEAIPREPVSSVEVIEGVSFHMEQDTYPVNPAYVTVILDNKTNTVYDYDINSYAIEKYISGQWQMLEYPYGVAGVGRFVSEHRQIIDTFSLAAYDYLGEGLYRIPVYAYEGDYYKRAEGYVEFALSKDAKALPYTLEEKKKIDEETRAEWQWYTAGELLKKLADSENLFCIRSWTGTGAAAVMQCVAAGTERWGSSAPSWFVYGDRSSGYAALVLDEPLYDPLVYLNSDDVLWLALTDTVYCVRYTGGKISCTANSEPFPLEDYLTMIDDSRRTLNHYSNGVATTEIYYEGLQSGYYTNGIAFEIKPEFYSAGDTRINLNIKSEYNYKDGNIEVSAALIAQVLTQEGWKDIGSDLSVLDLVMKPNDSKKLTISMSEPLIHGLYRLRFTDAKADFGSYHIDTEFSLSFYVP